MTRLFTYFEQNLKSPQNVHIQSPAKWVSWHGLHEWWVRGQWREIGQWLWVIHCSTDHVDSWMLTTSDRWSREQGCWHVLSQPDLPQRQEVVGLRQSVHAPFEHWQEDLPTGRRLYLQSVSRYKRMTHPVQHPHQPPLKSQQIHLKLAVFSCHCCCFPKHVNRMKLGKLACRKGQ